MLCLVKKLTVIGIIGKTQGVNKAAKPPRKAKKKMDHNPFFSSFLGIIELFFVSNEVVYDSTGLPSAKIVFKVKNSSGKVLTAIHARVEKK